jgi:hypothetical protein
MPTAQANSTRVKGPEAIFHPKQENAPPAPGKRAILDWEKSQ